jgi:hypothetical protein
MPSASSWLMLVPSSLRLPAPVNLGVRSRLKIRSGNSVQRLWQMSTSVQVHTSSTRESLVVPRLFSLSGKGLRITHRHSHARTLMFANAASVLTQAVVRILKFGVLLASSSFTGCSVMSQSTITGLGASTRSVCLSHSLEFWRQQQKFTVARPHLNFICRVFQGPCHRCKT